MAEYGEFVKYVRGVVPFCAVGEEGPEGERRDRREREYGGKDVERDLRFGEAEPDEGRTGHDAGGDARSPVDPAVAGDEARVLREFPKKEGDRRDGKDRKEDQGRDQEKPEVRRDHARILDDPEKPAEDDESFEIVRRRLFQPLSDPAQSALSGES